MQKGPPGLSFLQWEREHSRGQPAPPSIVHQFAGAPTLISPHRTAEESMGLSLWESDCDGEAGKGLQQPAHGPQRTQFIPAAPKQ